MKSFWIQNWFVFLLWSSLALAYFWPQIGIDLARKVPVNLLLTLLIFFCIGLTLPSETLRHSLSNWHFHIAVQGYIFVFTPLIFGLVLWLCRTMLGIQFSQELILGMIVLALLPSSVSSSVLFCKESGGNETLSVVNTVIANILGIFITPLLLAFIISVYFPQILPSVQTSSNAQTPDGLLLRFLLKALLPILLGHLGRRIAFTWVQRYKQQISIASNLGIVLIVFFSFSKAASSFDFQNPEILTALMSLLLLQPLMVLLAQGFARLSTWSRVQQIAFVFTSSQKTIAVGVPIISSLLGSDLGLILFPLLIYHPWQLIVASIVRITYVLQGNR